MNLLKISRKYHRYLMLFLGVQFVIWTVSGAYMVIIDIDYIHGDTLVHNHQTKIAPDDVHYSLAQLTQAYPKAEQLELGMLIDKPVYRFKQGDQLHMLNASTGAMLSPLPKESALAIAQHEYTGMGNIALIELITENPPFELSGRHLPAWRVNYDDFGSPSLYISALSGKVVTKRHEFWRTFDLMFSLHVMDYEEEDPSNWLLFWFVCFALLASLFGLILTYYQVFKNDTVKPTAQVSSSHNEGVSS
ncbi:hypothetical protein [Shewanella woodyi]|uniref:PepSY-associated TM helix domain protein n=1 Tax=Shewanella woodyi (strain ATCC 51908 / MS32) TaxID=392500 RepID=B1KF73_SHEWM|nr:hypothetical protein [Shewanella woodyi]ACA86614.1 conserved hypothetical protein [Shewanella woodyi ATCC 51908]